MRSASFRGLASGPLRGGARIGALALGCLVGWAAAPLPAQPESPRAPAFARHPFGSDLSFAGDRFTFCRVRYTSRYRRADGRRAGGGDWRTDYPDSDENFTLRLAELTSLDVNPRPAIVNLTDPELFDFPFLYMIEVGALEFQEEEIEPLREYLLRGGFLLVDDFWGEEEWDNWAYEIARVLPPERYPIVDVPLDHELFRCVFEIREVPQVPSIHAWMRHGMTYERRDAREAHCRGIFDEKRRLMVVAMHNTDLGDGWEREGESPEYFAEFSAKRAYPMGINIAVYAMTH